MKIAVVGAGNSGCAHAFKLAERGHTVHLIKTSRAVHDAGFDAIAAAGGIEAIDTTNGSRQSFARLALVTRDIPAGIEGTDAVLVLTQSLQHRDLAPVIAPCFRSGQLVLLVPGNMGSELFARYVREPDVVFAEAESTPYDARIVGPGRVEILFRNVRNAVAFREKRHEIHLPKVDELFGCHKYLRTNLVEAAMHNPNMVVHTVGTVMSASRIEYARGEFWMYREAFSPSVWNLVRELDAEKNAVIGAYGGVPMSYLDACRWRNEEDLTCDSLTVFKKYAAFGGPKGPASLDTRFIHEDVPMGLCLLERLAAHKRLQTPVASALVTLASALTRTDYRAQAYTIEELGLETMER